MPLPKSQLQGEAPLLAETLRRSALQRAAYVAHERLGPKRDLSDVAGLVGWRTTSAGVDRTVAAVVRAMADSVRGH